MCMYVEIMYPKIEKEKRPEKKINKQQHRRSGNNLSKWIDRYASNTWQKKYHALYHGYSA